MEYWQKEHPYLALDVMQGNYYWYTVGHAHLVCVCSMQACHQMPSSHPLPRCFRRLLSLFTWAWSVAFFPSGYSYSGGSRVTVTVLVVGLGL